MLCKQEDMGFKEPLQGRLWQVQFDAMDPGSQQFIVIVQGSQSNVGLMDLIGLRAP